MDEQRRLILYCPTQLACAWASWDLSDTLYALRSPLETVSAVMDQLVVRQTETTWSRFDSDGNEFLPVPHRGMGWSLLLVTAERLLTVDWDNLSEDPEGKIRKRAAWAYLAALPPETQIVVSPSRTNWSRSLPGGPERDHPEPT